MLNEALSWGISPEDAISIVDEVVENLDSGITAATEQYNGNAAIFADSARRRLSVLDGESNPRKPVTSMTSLKRTPPRPPRNWKDIQEHMTGIDSSNTIIGENLDGKATPSRHMLK